MKQKAVCKFDLGGLLPLALTIVVIGIGLTYGVDVLTTTRDDFVANSAQRNTTVDAIDSTGELTEKLPTIATVIVAAVIISILVRYMMVRYN